MLVRFADMISEMIDMSPIIKNYNRISRSTIRQEAIDIFLEGIEAVQPAAAIPKFFSKFGKELKVGNKRYNLSRGRIFVIGGGKGAGMMAKIVEDIIGDSNHSGGIVIDKDINVACNQIDIRKGGHPYPTIKGVSAVRDMLSMTSDLTPNDIIFCLIMGGGSSLLTCPAPGLDLHDLQKTYQVLLFSGAPIHEINIVRKHLTSISGGQLLKHLQPANVITFVISDTFDTKYDSTASGPTCPDVSTYDMAMDIITKRDLLNKIPKCVIQHLKNGMMGLIPETLKKSDIISGTVQHIVIATNIDCLRAMQYRSQKFGFNTRIISENLTGDVNDVAAFIESEIRKIHNLTTCCILAGGEPTVVVRGQGKGGRCQQLTALLIKKIATFDESVFIAAGTDGNDYLQGVGGAIVDNNTMAEASSMDLNIDSLILDNNTYILHKKMDNLILTFPTNTNVCDVMVFLCKKR